MMHRELTGQIGTASRPREVVARIDARRRKGLTRVGPETRVAGLTLLGRHVLTAEYLGWAGVEILVDDEAEREQIAALLRRDPAPSRLSVAIVVPAPDIASPEERWRGIALDLYAVYDRETLAAYTAAAPPEPLAVVTGLADVRGAREALLHSVRKSVSHDGVVGAYVLRRLSDPIVRLLLDTPVTPNQVTIVAGLCGLVAGVLAATGGNERAALAGVLVWIGAVIDCVDGDLARLRFQSSRLGQWLDSIADDFSTAALQAGLGIGLAVDGSGAAWGYGGTVCGVLMFGTSLKMWIDLDRWRLPIDTARYPWSFGDPARRIDRDAGIGERVLYGLGFVMKRDAFLTIVAAILLFGLRRSATVLLCAGSLIIFVLQLANSAWTALVKRR